MFAPLSRRGPHSRIAARNPGARVAAGCHCADERAAPCTLLAGCRLELHDQSSGYPAAILHLNTLSLGPLAYLGGVQPACRSPAGTAGRPPGNAAGPPGSTHVACQGIPQLLGMPGFQVDLVLRAVQAETDGSLGGTAVKVIDEQSLYLLSHGRSGPLTDL
jgi:hypothetical protein